MAGSQEWSSPAHVARYLARTEAGPFTITSDLALLEQIPRSSRRILDLGTGDGRLVAMLLEQEPARTAVGLDSSELMLTAARERFAGDDRAKFRFHDLNSPLPELGSFDAVVSSLAIHHLEHPRKRALYGEVLDVLGQGGVFANFDHVASVSRRLHLEFFAAIDEPLEHEDASDRLLDVHSQLEWLRELGFEEVDCHWKWRELALMVGRRGPVEP
jgi:tRNA (cmo5U34)-methyltransferase